MAASIVDGRDERRRPLHAAPDCLVLGGLGAESRPLPPPNRMTPIPVARVIPIARAIRGDPEPDVHLFIGPEMRWLPLAGLVPQPYQYPAGVVAGGVWPIGLSSSRGRQLLSSVGAGGPFFLIDSMALIAEALDL